MSSFNPYREWLDIETDGGEPDHYQLLGLSREEFDPLKIAEAGRKITSRVRSIRPGKQLATWTNLLDKIELAVKTLSERGARADYDNDATPQKIVVPNSLTSTGSSSSNPKSSGLNSMDLHSYDPPQKKTKVKKSNVVISSPETDLHSHPDLAPPTSKSKSNIETAETSTATVSDTEPVAVPEAKPVESNNAGVELPMALEANSVGQENEKHEPAVESQTIASSDPVVGVASGSSEDDPFFVNTKLHPRRSYQQIVIPVVVIAFLFTGVVATIKFWPQFGQLLTASSDPDKSGSNADAHNAKNGIGRKNTDSLANDQQQATDRGEQIKPDKNLVDQNNDEREATPLLPDSRLIDHDAPSKPQSKTETENKVEPKETEIPGQPAAVMQREIRAFYVRAILSKLSEGETYFAAKLVTRFQALAKNDSDELCAERLHYLTDQVELFWSKVEDAADRLKGGAHMLVGKKQITIGIVESQRSMVIYRSLGENYRLPARRLPPGVAIAIVESTLGSDDQSFDECKAALYLASTPGQPSLQPKTRGLIAQATTLRNEAFKLKEIWDNEIGYFADQAKVKKPASRDLKEIEMPAIPNSSDPFQMVEFVAAQEDPVLRYAVYLETLDQLTNSRDWQAAEILLNEIEFLYDVKIAEKKTKMFYSIARSKMKNDEFDGASAEEFVFQIIRFVKRYRAELKDSEVKRMISISNEIAEQFSMKKLQQTLSQVAGRDEKKYRQEAGILVDSP